MREDKRDGPSTIEESESGGKRDMTHKETDKRSRYIAESEERGGSEAKEDSGKGKGQI